jgi:hypothetical protein
MKKLSLYFVHATQPNTAMRGERIAARLRRVVLF